MYALLWDISVGFLLAGLSSVATRLQFSPPLDLPKVSPSPVHIESAPPALEPDSVSVGDAWEFGADIAKHYVKRRFSRSIFGFGPVNGALTATAAGMAILDGV